MEAPEISWRPLGRLLVDKGLLTESRLEEALAAQAESGGRLGDTLVELGYVSRQTLARALAEQYGMELTVETGFGTGLQARLERKHDQNAWQLASGAQSDEGLPPLVLVQPLPDPEPEEDDKASQLAALEEQWARLAAAEERVEEMERELATVRKSTEHREAQVARFVTRVRRRDAQIAELSAASAQAPATVDEAEPESGRRFFRRRDSQAADAELQRLADELHEQEARRAELESELVTMLERIAARDEQVETLEKEVSGLQSAAEEKERENAALLEEKALVEDRLRDMPDEGELDRLRNEVEAAASRVAESAQELETARDATRSGQAEIERLGEELRQRDDQLVERAADAARHGEDLRRRDERVGELERELEELRERDGASAQLGEELRQRDERIGALEQELGELRGSAFDRDGELGRLAEELRQRDERAGEVEREAEWLRGVVRDHESEVARLGDELRQRDEQLGGREQELAALREQLSNAEAELAGLRENSEWHAELEREIERLGEELRGRDTQVAEAESELTRVRESGERRKELKLEIQRLHEEIEGLRNVAGEHESELEHFAEELRRRDLELAQRETELQSLRDAGAAAEAVIGELGRTIDERSARLEDADRAREQVERVARRREAQVVRLIGRARERRLAEAAGPEPANEHLLYAQLADRYVLVECQGPPPEAGAVLEVGEASERPLVVDRVGRSPLPADERPCAFAYELPPAADEAAA